MNCSSSQSGFTLIEMIVSLAVFSGVITIAVGALLVLVGSNEQLQGEQSVMTNLSFALDSMTREIRTGTDYYCISYPNYNSGGVNNIFEDGRDLDGILNGLTSDCSGKQNVNWDLHGVSFVEGGNSVSGGNDRIVYFFDQNLGQIFRRIGTGSRVSIVSSGIFVNKMDFYVTGSDPQSSGGLDQASVTVYIEATEKNDPSAKVYRIQTTITQRTLDI